MPNGNVLLTHTLPTVVGAGVVSRSTETLFGRGDSRRKHAPGRAPREVRKFGGKTYYSANWHSSKARAETDAGHFRKAGHPARVVRYYNTRLRQWGYMVFVRG